MTPSIVALRKPVFKFLHCAVPITRVVHFVLMNCKNRYCENGYLTKSNLESMQSSSKHQYYFHRNQAFEKMKTELKLPRESEGTHRNEEKGEQGSGWVRCPYIV